MTVQRRVPLAPSALLAAPAPTAEVFARSAVPSAWHARPVRPIVEATGAAVDAVAKEPDTGARLADLGAMKPDLTPDGGTTPDASATFVREEVRRRGEIVRRSGATPD